MKPSRFNQRSWLVYQQQELWKLWQMCRISVPWHTYKIYKYFHCNYVSSETSNHGQGLTCSRERGYGVAGHRRLDPQRDKLDLQILKDFDLVWMDWITSCDLGSFWWSKKKGLHQFTGWSDCHWMLSNYEIISFFSPASVELWSKWKSITKKLHQHNCRKLLYFAVGFSRLNGYPQRNMMITLNGR